ncbi:hypothetical protein SAMN05444398_101862 [Roseovarius pacificus]|uniref:Uncharacterized protein n=1 Tax=Roseovarius pacificus TaxID=337701 RepID=A0A1M6YHL7_9RHOB|nr:hypothetical protein SAMN05444398_101862 [Roseovarius pacificus]
MSSRSCWPEPGRRLGRSGACCLTQIVDRYFRHLCNCAGDHASVVRTAFCLRSRPMVGILHPAPPSHPRQETCHRPLDRPRVTSRARGHSFSSCLLGLNPFADLRDAPARGVSEPDGGWYLARLGVAPDSRDADAEHGGDFFILEKFAGNIIHDRTFHVRCNPLYSGKIARDVGKQFTHSLGQSVASGSQ